MTKEHVDKFPVGDFGELVVTYTFDEERWQEEFGLPFITEVISDSVKLKYVDLVIGSEITPILYAMNQAQKEELISNLSYE